MGYRQGDVVYDVVAVRDLPELFQKTSRPKVERLQDLQAGQRARIAVKASGGLYDELARVNGPAARFLFPWIEIIRVPERGEYAGLPAEPNWLDAYVMVSFGAENIVDVEGMKHK
ncbi:MAG: hypothetical protein IT515_08070 [Burkholderiales bacterium]|nr:hypothetical protein [Burkholderiales bacterium]